MLFVVIFYVNFGLYFIKAKKIMLKKILWVFNDTSYDNKVAFNQDVTDSQIEILGNADNWQPDAVVFELPQLYIQYEAWINGVQDLFANEILTAESVEHLATTEPEYDEFGYQVEILAKLTADNGKDFTALELLQKIHHQMLNKDLGDHIFFEGLEQIEDYKGLPTYNVWCGS